LALWEKEGLKQVGSVPFRGGQKEVPRKDKLDDGLAAKNNSKTHAMKRKEDKR